VRPCAIPEQTLLARYLGYLGYLLTEFDQTSTTNGLWEKDDCIKFWGQKIKGQHQSGVKYAPKMHFLVL